MTDALGPKFPLGQIVATPAALEVFNHPTNVADLDSLLLVVLTRHVAGDWGDLDEEDRAANDHAAILGERLLSAYNLADSTRVWVITEADRSVTTVLLPSDY